MLNTRYWTSEKADFSVPRAIPWSRAAGLGGAGSGLRASSAPAWPSRLLRMPIRQSSPTRNEENSEAYRLPRRLPRGDDSELQPLDVKIANRGLFAKWSGTEIKIDGEDFVVAKESDIMGVVE